jgi:hypothetical protein
MITAGDVAPALLDDDAGVQERIRRQPMLNWKAQHVRSRSSAR